MKQLYAVLFLATAVATTGCSVNRALNKPSPKDLSFLTRGASRDAVRSELGDFTVSSDTSQCDVHSYTEGSGGGKYARAFIYSILDLGSAGVFEIFLNPIEASIGNDKVRTRACYNDRNLLVKASEFHKGGRETRLQLIPADDPALEASLDAPVSAPVAVAVPAPAVAYPVAEPAAVAEPVAIAAPAALAESVPVAVVAAPEAVAADSAVQPALPVAAAAVASEASVVVAPVDAAPAQAAPTEIAPVESVSAEAASAVAAPAADVKPAATVKKAKSRKPSVKRKS